MESINRGFQFLAQSWRLANTRRSLFKAAGRGLAAGLLLALLFSLLAAALLLVFHFSLIGAFLAGLLGSIGLAALPILSYLCVSSAFPALATALSGQEPEALPTPFMPPRWSDLLSLALALIPASLLRNRGRGILRAPWTAAPELVRPALILEKLTLKGALARTSGILQSSALLMHPAQVNVTLVGWLINLPSWLVGAALGLLAGTSLAQALPGGWGFILGIACGTLVFGLLASSALAVTQFTSAAYQICLYLWVRQVEQGQPGNLPLPLAKALAGASSITAPIFSE